MADPPDLFAELKLLIAAGERMEQLLREGIEHQQAGRLDEARKALEQAEDIERRMRALRDAKR